MNKLKNYFIINIIKGSKFQCEKQLENILKMQSLTQNTSSQHAIENTNKKKPVQSQNQQNQYELQIKILTDENNVLKRKIEELQSINHVTTSQIDNQKRINEGLVNEIHELKSNSQEIDRSKLLYIATTIFNSIGTSADLQNINLNASAVEKYDKMV